MHEFVRGLEPLSENLILWRDMAVGNGPFHRVEHTLVRTGVPSRWPASSQGDSQARAPNSSKANLTPMAVPPPTLTADRSPSGCKCKADAIWNWRGLNYTGCAKPLGWEEYM